MEYEVCIYCLKGVNLNSSGSEMARRLLLLAKTIPIRHLHQRIQISVVKRFTQALLLGKTMIEVAYLDHVDAVSKAHGGRLRQTSKGAHVQKHTWLASAWHCWNQMQLVLQIDSEEDRLSRLKEIRSEIENPAGTEIVKEFQRNCFPDVPMNLILATWKYAGMTMFDHGLGILELPPGDQRNRLRRKLDTEFAKLEAVWMVPPGDEARN